MRFIDVSPVNNRIFIKEKSPDPMEGEVNDESVFTPDNGLIRRGVFGGKRDGKDDFEQHKRDVEEALRYYDELSNGNQASNEDEGR